MVLTIAIRTDGSTVIGLGHVTNCLALAEHLKRYFDQKERNNKVDNEVDYKIIFIMKNFSESVQKVKNFGYEVIEINNEFSEEETAQETLLILKKLKAAMLITDLLEINYDFSDQLKELGIKSVSIDILGKIKLQSDIIFNRTIIAERFKNYCQDGNIQYYLGPDYVILNKQFLGLAEKKREINEKVKNILICLGGGDEFNITARIVKLINSIPDQTSKIKPTIILGAAFKGQKELQEALDNSIKDYLMVKDVRNMAEYMLKSDLAVCAGGSILYELAVTGTPALIIPMNDHQVENAAAFSKQGSVISTKLHTEVTNTEILEKINELCHDYEQRKKMSQLGKQITDGKGAERTAKIIGEFLIK